MRTPVEDQVLSGLWMVGRTVDPVLCNLCSRNHLELPEPFLQLFHLSVLPGIAIKYIGIVPTCTLGMWRLQNCGECTSQVPHFFRGQLFRERLEVEVMVARTLSLPFAFCCRETLLLFFSPLLFLFTLE